MAGQGRDHGRAEPLSGLHKHVHDAADLVREQKKNRRDCAEFCAPA